MPNITTKTTTERLTKWFANVFSFSSATQRQSVSQAATTKPQSGSDQALKAITHLGARQSAVEVTIAPGHDPVYVLAGVFAEAIDAIQDRGTRTYIRQEITRDFLDEPCLTFTATEGSGTPGANAVRLIHKAITGVDQELSTYTFTLAELLSAQFNVLILQDMLQTTGLGIDMDSKAASVLIFLSSLQLFVDPDAIVSQIIAADQSWRQTHNPSVPALQSADGKGDK